MIKVVYIGYSDEIILEILESKEFELAYVISSPNKLNQRTIDLLNKKAIAFYEICNKRELVEAFKGIECELVLIYKFGLIIPDELIKKYDFFNIHWGDLRTNRGAHSLRWTILLGESTTRITLYHIEGIDEGTVVREEAVLVDYNDDVITLPLKMEKKLPLLLSELPKYYYSSDKVKYKKICGGVYRKKIQEADYSIDLDKDDYLTILHKINCVKDFGGATIHINGILYRAYDVKVLTERETINIDNVVLKPSDEGNYICVFYKQYELL